MSDLRPHTYLYDDYTPSISASASAHALDMTEDEKAAAAERERRRGTFGFGRELDEPPDWAPLVWEGSD